MILRTGRGAFVPRPSALLAMAVPLLLVAGCKRHDPVPHRPVAADSQVVAAAETVLRGAVPSGRAAAFRGEQVYAQARAERVAVCGQVSPFPNDPALFVPFVAVETISAAGRVSPPDTVFAGTDVDAADRTYAALVVHCYDGGGPGSDPMQSVPSLPPVPNTVPEPASGATSGAAAPAGQPAGGTPAALPGPTDAAPGGGAVDGVQPASGTATARQNVNLHDAPHGAVVRVVPQGTALHVFAQAPGGWLQVGDAAPWGWIHESMLSRP